MGSIRSFLFLISVLFTGQAFSYPHYAVIEPHRTLMFFAPSWDENVEAFERQVLIHRCQIKDRDLYTLVLDMGKLSDSKGVFSANEVLRLKSKYGIDSQAHIAVLIGKDGTEKARWATSVDINELISVIDAMPMRQAEIQKRGLRCSI